MFGATVPTIKLKCFSCNWEYDVEHGQEWPRCCGGMKAYPLWSSKEQWMKQAKPESKGDAANSR